ncbi:MAG TPA: serine protease, partial [Planctomycetota bacterium]|nr:serine protease [Planctomycetota bacterium]
PAEPSKNPAPPALAGDVAEKCAPAVVLVTSDTDSGGGCFVAADGLVLTTHRAIAKSEVRTVTYIEGQGDARLRIVAEAEVVAVDLKHDLALLKIQVRKLVPFVTLGDARPAAGDDVALFTNPVPGTRSIDHVQVRGKVVSLEAMVDGVAHIQTTLPLGQANAGVPVFNKNGDVIGASTLRGEGAAAGSVAIPVAHLRALIDGRETTFAIKGTFRDWTTKNAGGTPGSGPAPKEHPTGIGVGGVITRLHLDEERDRIIGLDVDSNCVIVMSLSKRKIERKIPTAMDAVDLQMTVNPDVAWVAHAETKHFLKMDVSDGRIFDRIDGVRFGRFVPTRNHLWAYGPTSHIVTLKDKSVVPNPLKLAALTYDRRKDRLIGLASNWETLKLVEFDPDKLAPLLREIGEIKKAGATHPKWRELDKMMSDLESQWTMWSVPPRYEEWAPTGWMFSLLTDCTTRVILNRFSLKRGNMDMVLMRYPLIPVPETASKEMMNALKRFGRLDNFQDISPDGKWLSTGRHILNAETGDVKVEFAVPTPDSKFSGNSKILYVYDLTERAIVPIEVEPKK